MRQSASSKYGSLRHGGHVFTPPHQISQLHQKAHKKLAGEAGDLARYLGSRRPEPARPSRSGVAREPADAILPMRWQRDQTSQPPSGLSSSPRSLLDRDSYRPTFRHSQAALRSPTSAACSRRVVRKPTLSRLDTCAQGAWNLFWSATRRISRYRRTFTSSPAWRWAMPIPTIQ